MFDELQLTNSDLISEFVSWLEAFTTLSSQRMLIVEAMFKVPDLLFSFLRIEFRDISNFGF